MTAVFKQRDDDVASAITNVTTGTATEPLPVAAVAAAAAGVPYGQGTSRAGGCQNAYIGTNYILNVSLATRLPVKIHPQLPHIHHAVGP